MGYRSNIKIIIYGEPDKVDGFIAGQKLARPEAFSQWEGWGTPEQPTFSTHDIKRYDGASIKVFLFQVNDVKWYDGYEDADMWDKTILPLAADVGLNYEKVRVGEERDDIEFENEGGELIHLLDTHTEITMDF